MLQRYRYKAIAQNVFRAYDIRGVIGEQLDEAAISFLKILGIALMARFEAINSKSLGKIQSLFKDQLLAIDNTLTIPFNECDMSTVSSM